jgi:hypothetical protein
MRHHQGDVTGNALGNRKVIAQEPLWLAREKIQCRLQPPPEPYGCGECGPHPGYKGRATLGKRVALIIRDDPRIPGLNQRFKGLWNGYLISGRWLPQSRAYIKSNAVASLTDFYDSHKIVWQHALHDLRDMIKYLADIENVGQGVEQAIEDFEPRSKILMRYWPTGSVFP